MFIKRISYGGMDWHDSYETITQIKPKIPLNYTQVIR